MHTLLLLASLSEAKMTGSSVVEDERGKHTADLAADGLLTTAWAEGQSGYGEGSWLELDLGTSTKIESLSIWPGDLSDGRRSFREHSRPKVFQISVDGKPVGEPVRLMDELKRIDVPLTATGRKVRLDFMEVYEGMVFADLYITEVGVNFVAGDRARGVEKIEAWRGTSEAEKLQAQHEEQVLAMFQQHKANTDDMDSLNFLISAAADGAPYLRKKVASLVPDGYRVAALVPDEKSMLAIRKLKNPNAIPGLEMAAMRLTGEAQKDMEEIIQIFYAYQELVGGGRRNIKAWGEKGWEVGAFLSFNEPLPIEVDQFGGVYVADIGNNRIQRFNQDGVSEKQWGGAPDASHAWFDGTRNWYAAGSGASEEKGQFTNPLDVELIPGKEGDGFMVVDAKKRVQIFDMNGAYVRGWTVSNVDYDPQDRLGGDTFLAYLAKKEQVLVLTGGFARLYSIEGEQIGAWKIKDGTPSAAEMGKDGKLYLGFEDKVIAYNPVDGFRYGVVIDGTILGEGFDDLDIARDEEGKLWIITDIGDVYKFKKPGKLEWKVQVSEVHLERPRLTVYQGFLYVTDRNRIMTVDALQLHLDEQEAEAAAKEGEKK